MFDLVIKNGLVVSDLKKIRTDVAITNDKIVAIGENLHGRDCIDVTGKIVSPGFIDMHTHSDVSFLKNETNDSKLYQGITTELVGCCGFSHYPYTSEGLSLLDKNNEKLPYDVCSLTSFKETYRKPMSLNWASLIGHGPLRRSVIGDSNVIATDEQVDRMKTLLDQELSNGGFGLSLGMAYAPGMFADTNEYIELAKVCKKHNKIVSAHIRNENIDVFESVNEMIHIARLSGAHIHISHLKLGYGSWSRSMELLDIIDKAVSEGTNITFEQYPYIASATGLSAVLPDWVHDGGIEKMMYRFTHERDRVIKGIESSNSFEMGLDRVIVVSTDGFMEEANGQSIRDISLLLKESEAETVIYLLENLNCDVPTIRFTMLESDVYTISKRKDCVVISDGSAYSLDSNQVDGNPHPRSYGTFPRFLRLNRINQWMSLEEALYKMTSLPARLINLKHRGKIQVGYYADITIFDEATVSDQATFDDAIQAPLGIEYVIINGKIALDQRATDERAGEMLLSF